MEEVEQSIANITQGNLPAQVIVAALILVAVAVLSHLVVRWLRHVMRKGDNPLPQSSIFVNITRVVVWGMGICFVMDACFGVNATAIIAALGVGGIAISLGFQDTLTNLIGGVQISFMRVVQPGDNIRVSGNEGVVQDVTWRHTTIKNRVGETVIIPNSVISKNPVVQLPPVEHVVVSFESSVNENMDELAERITCAVQDAVLEVAGLNANPQVLFTQITGTGTSGKVIVDIDDPSKVNPTIDAAVRAMAPLVRL